VYLKTESHPLNVPTCFELKGGEFSSSLCCFDAQGKKRLQISPSGSSLTLFDPSEIKRMAVSLSGDDHLPVLHFYDSQGQPQIMFYQSRDGFSLSLYGGQSGRNALIGGLTLALDQVAFTRGLVRPSLSLFDPHGTFIWERP